MYPSGPPPGAKSHHFPNSEAIPRSPLRQLLSNVQIHFFFQPRPTRLAAAMPPSATAYFQAGPCQVRREVRPEGASKTKPGRGQEPGETNSKLMMGRAREDALPGREKNGYGGRVGAAFAFALLEKKAFSVHLQNMHVMSKPIPECTREPFQAQYFGPLLKEQVTGHQGRVSFVALAEDLEQELQSLGRRWLFPGDAGRDQPSQQQRHALCCGRGQQRQQQ